MEPQKMTNIWYEKNYVYRMIYLVTISPEGFKPMDFRDKNHINSTAAKEIPQDLIIHGIFYKNNHLLYCTAIGKELGSLFQKIFLSYDDLKLELLERTSIGDFLSKIKNAPTPLSQGDLRKEFSQSVVSKNLELGIAANLLQEQNSKYLLTQEGLDLFPTLEKLWEILSNASLSVDTVNTNLVKFEQQEQCYFCKRSKDDFKIDFQLDYFGQQLTTQIATKINKLQVLINNQVKYLQTLQAECRKYNLEFTLEDLDNLGESTNKVAPRWKELAQFIPKSEFKEELTLSETLEYLTRIIPLYEFDETTDFTKFTTIGDEQPINNEKTDVPYSSRLYRQTAPHLFYDLYSDRHYDDTIYEKNRKAIQNEAKKLPPSTITSNLNPKLPWTHQLLEMAFDRNWNEVKILYRYTNNNHKEFQYEDGKEKSVPSNEIYHFQFSILLCPICEKKFNLASQSSYLIQKEEEDRRSDWD